MSIKNYTVRGMTCSACVNHVEKAVKGLPGVQHVEVELLTNRLRVEFQEDMTVLPDIEAAVKHAGYQAEAQDASGTPRDSNTTDFASVLKEESQSMQQRFLYSVVFWLPMFYLGMGSMLGLPTPGIFEGSAGGTVNALTQLLLLVPILGLNRSYFVSGSRALWQRNPTMDSLIAIGSFAATLQGVVAFYGMLLTSEHSGVHHLYFESAATILTLVTMGKWMESRSKLKTTDAIRGLMQLTPLTALRIESDQTREVPVSALKPGDVLLLKPGQTVPVDGVVLTGESTVNMSALTGESMPVRKTVGEELLASGINQQGALTYRATAVGVDTRLSKVIRLVEAAAVSKAPISQLADRISAVFVPIVLVVALLASLTWALLGEPASVVWSIAISVLVISCPCALGLATPVAIMAGTGSGARMGLLFRSAAALQRLSAVQAVVLDKTGTLTQGKPTLRALWTSPDVRESDVLHVASGLERFSEHPLATAILEAAAARNLPAKAMTDFQSRSGLGIEAHAEDGFYSIGNLEWMQLKKMDVSLASNWADGEAKQGRSPLYVSGPNGLMGVLSVADVLKPESKEAVQALHQLGLTVYMMTGDHLDVANAIAEELGISNVFAGVMPEDKDSKVQGLQRAGKVVLMVGDGINDAPALVRADVGMAVGSAADVALDAADVVLSHGRLTDAIEAIRLSRSVMRVIRQNLFWAFFYNAIGIPLAAGVWYAVSGHVLSPMFAAAAMSLSSVTVVLNALRLRYIQSTNQRTKQVITMKTKMYISGMTCAHCSGRVSNALNALEGVDARVDLADGTAVVEHPNRVSQSSLKAAVESAGYDVSKMEDLI